MISKLMQVLGLLLVMASAGAQSLADDVALIKAQDNPPSGNTYYSGSPVNNRAVLKTREQTVLAKYNPAALLLKGTMAVYQHVISPQLARGCPYEITCSNFSKQAIKEYGMVKGVFLTADRIMRCNRIGLLDIHPLDINEKNGKIADSPNQYR